MIELIKTAKLPLKICKGTYEERFELAKKLNKKFFERLSPQFKTKDITPDTFEKTLKEIPDANIKFSITDSSEHHFYGATILNKNPEKPFEADRYKIYMPLNRYDKSISLNDTNVFMHETFHYFCELANPKHNRRNIRLYEKGLAKDSEKFYNKCLYTKKNIDNELLENFQLPVFLVEMDKPDRIDILQSFRYRLKEELDAWKEGHKYYNKIQDEHTDIVSEKFDCDNGDDYKFKEKIEIIERVLKKEFQELRNKFKFD